MLSNKQPRGDSSAQKPSKKHENEKTAADELAWFLYEMYAKHKPAHRTNKPPAPNKSERDSSQKDDIYA